MKTKNGSDMCASSSSPSDIKGPRAFTSQSSKSKLLNLAVSQRVAGLLQLQSNASPLKSHKIKGKPLKIEIDDQISISDDLVPEEGETARDSSLIRHRNAYLDDDLRA